MFFEYSLRNNSNSLKDILLNSVSDKLKFLTFVFLKALSLSSTILSFKLHPDKINREITDQNT